MVTDINRILQDSPNYKMRGIRIYTVNWDISLRDKVEFEEEEEKEEEEEEKKEKEKEEEDEKKKKK